MQYSTQAQHTEVWNALIFSPPSASLPSKIYNSHTKLNFPQYSPFNSEMQEVVCQRSTFNNKLWILSLLYWQHPFKYTHSNSWTYCFLSCFKIKKENKLVEQIWKWLLVVGECMHRLNFHKTRLFRIASNTLGMDKRRPLGYEHRSQTSNKITGKATPASKGKEVDYKTG